MYSDRGVRHVVFKSLYLTFSEVFIASKCHVTPAAIKRRRILMYKNSVAKNTEYKIPVHKKPMENIFDPIVIPFPEL